MVELLRLGARLVAAGGRARAWSAALGSAVAVVMLLAASVLPEAIYPDPWERQAMAVQVTAVSLFMLVPAAVLLGAVGRFSSGTRDRRLAELRLLGLTPGRTRIVATVEAAVPAAAGAALGAALFLFALVPAARAMGRLPAQAAPAAWAVAAAVVGVPAVSAALGTAATWERVAPDTVRSPAARRPPRPWRLAVLAAGAGGLVWVATIGWDRVPGMWVIWIFLGSAIAAAVGLALTIPLVTYWIGAWLARSRHLTPLLAGRAIQADPTSAGRMVAGLGVGLYLVVGALSVLTAFETTPHLAYAAKAFGEGPQDIFVRAGAGTGAGPERLAAADLASLQEVPGVLGLAPNEVWVVPESGDESGQSLVLVGTCDQLALVLAATGCDDARAARIAGGGLDQYADAAGEPLPDTLEAFLEEDSGGLATPGAAEKSPEASGAAGSSKGGRSGANGADSGSPLDGPRRLVLRPAPDPDQVAPKEAGPNAAPEAAMPDAASPDAASPEAAEPDVADPAATIRLDGSPIRVDAQSGETDPAFFAAAFVPEGLIPGGVPPRESVTAMAEGGAAVQARVQAWAAERGHTAFVLAAHDFAFLQSVRLAIWTLSGAVMAVALLILTLGAVDRTRERRRVLARQVAIGTPPRLMRAAGLVETLTPTAAALALGLAAGLLLDRAYANADYGSAALNGGSWVAIGLMAAAGVGAVALATWPMTRVRLTAGLLRRE
ncbi:MAG: hypothetical protein LBL01_06140 [Bifidobacteriaceae bacterium]|nr:hypothetical protein [Bifidobacteriaceae bacterium]